MAITWISKQVPLTRLYSKIIGIARETKGVWECRAPLTPSAVHRLSEKYDLQFKVESSRKRIFSDSHYAQKNAKIVSKLEDCDLILGIKQPAIEQIQPSTAYLFFSHTRKGQPHNMPLLKRICEAESSLYDYELLSDPETGERLVAFGKYAGYSGMIMALHGLGLALLQRGIRSPFLNIPQTQVFTDVQAAKDWLSSMQFDSICSEPLVFVFTGTGRVSRGAQEIFKCLPHEFVSVEELPRLMKEFKSDRVYGCVVEAKDYAVKHAGQFSRDDYYSHPERYRSRFHELILPYTSVLVHGIYWEPQFPRILEEVHLPLAERLISIADISCDLNGAIKFTSHPSTIDEPFWDLKGVQMMTIDNLPAQLPRDASEYFSNKLETLLPAFAGLESSTLVDESQIVSKGSLTSKFTFLQEEMEKVPPPKKKALILGSGYVSGPVIEYLQAADIETVVASNEDKLGVIKIDVQDASQLSPLIESSDIVISLVSAHLHVEIAKACIKHKRPLVTASYISAEMQCLNLEAEIAGVLLLNEIGLDPGLDHLTAMKMIREARAEGFGVESFISWCGGLPAPEDSANILGYKFSWSPRGVLLACQNSARYLRQGELVELDSNDLLLSAERVTSITPGFAFEGLPNRDSLKYKQLYGIPEAKTMMRGTLRYEGFSSMMHQFQLLGLLNHQESNCLTWLEYLQQQLDTAISTQTLMTKLGLTLFEANRLFKALDWLGLLDSAKKMTASTPFDAFCALLQQKLSFAANERDMVLLHHDFVFKDPQGRFHHKTATICEYGQVGGFSAMARTVGYPVAVAAKLILEGVIKATGVQAPLSVEFTPILTELLERNLIKIK